MCTPAKLCATAAPYYAPPLDNAAQRHQLVCRDCLRSQIILIVVDANAWLCSAAHRCKLL
eukprot:15449501-Alexandrium_andersonii.AAC.1